MRAAQISAIILGLIAVIAGAVGAFYWVGAALGVVAQALFGAAYIGVAVANAHTLLLVLVMILASLLTLAERKWSALMQDRIGPNRARFALPGLSNRSLAGLPHFLADGIKMLTKEDFVPDSASKGLFTLAPMLAFAPIFLLFAVVPIAPVLTASDIPGIAGLAASMGVSATFPVSLQVVPDLEIGLLYVFAFASLAVYGTAIAGWASNNRFAFMGGVRAASQMIAYEVALGLSLVGAMMIFGSLKLEDMTAGQTAGLFGGALPAWGIFLQPIGFLVFFVASLAETKRAPFDAPEGESEIIGYFVEYSGMRFGMFMISEFVEIVVLSGITVSIFFGGFHLPLPPAWGAEAWLASHVGAFGLAVVLGMGFVLKVILLCWVQLTIRWTMPRFRYDQIQTLGWKILLPIGLANVFVTGALILADQSLDWLAVAGLAQLIFVIGLTVLYPSKKPISIRHSGGAPAQPAMPQGH
ncbi:MAG TPA: complex I subunit 1 family protein [Vulgatibacter sp.]|nr:complex I subunit 1 family protein [Vulgatibacter sp.]